MTQREDFEAAAERGQSCTGDWLVGGGEMGKLVRAKDWSKTPLGPIESWPQSLRTTVSLCLASNFPISLAWGPHHIQIYNDGYWPICGAKHPESMGMDFKVCWEAPWPVVGGPFWLALGGTTSYLEDQRMFLDRHGYLEETFFTFSFSPISDESGGVGGLFHPVTETTSRMLSERRTRTLRDLAARAGKAQTSEEAFSIAAQVLSEAHLDLPFVLFYSLRGEEAELVAASGLLPGAPASPVSSRLDEPAASWPLSRVVESGVALEIDVLAQHFELTGCGPYPEPPKVALGLPITPPGCERPVAVLVAGVSSRLPLNESYRAFYDLVVAGVTTAVANARAHEEERRRAEALAEIDRAKTAFFSNVSHEFRTPLTLMLGPLEDELGERESPLPAARRERIDTAYRNSLRLLKLVNTLLDFSRAEAGRAQARFVNVDLAARTEELASVFRAAVEKAGLSLTVDCERLPEPIYVDVEMWEKVVLNLLSNAFKHTFEGGIRVTLRWCKDHAELSVSDSGVGIARAELPRLFERFHRVTGAKSRSHEGTGIGLALVAQLIGLHGGSVNAKSEEGRGSTFTVHLRPGSAHLPAEHLQLEAESKAKSTQAEGYVQEALHWTRGVALGPELEPEREANAPRPRVLVADDNADMREYLCRLLAADYEVVAAPDGLAALQAATERQPDLIVSDVMMPGLDGFGLLRELRANPDTQALPLILLSARAGEDAAIDGLNAGADDYLPKPFSARELLARVRTHLELSRVRRRWAEEIRNSEAQQRAETAIRHSAETHRLLFEESPSPAYAVDAETLRLVAVNQAALTLYGYTRDEFLSLTLSALRHPEDEPALAAAFREAGDADASATVRHRHKNGTVIHLEGRHHLSTVEARPTRLVVVNDVTDRLLAESRSELAEAGLSRIEGALRDTEEQLRQSQKMDAIGRLAGGVAHDFNNLLSVILSYSDLMLGQLPASDPMRDDVLQVAQAGTRAAELTRQLLIFSRRELPDSRVLDLNALVSNIDSMLQRLVGEDVELETKLDAALASVRADPGSIEQVVMNLVVNARDAMPVGGRLTVETSNVGPHVRLSVRDTGMGMDRATQARIFEPFFTTKEIGKGTGLGLSTVFGIVQQSGGTVRVESELGKGTQFSVYLPQVAASSASAQPSTEDRSLHGTETILLVEDEAQVRLVARGILLRQGYHVIEAETGSEALLLAERNPGSIDLLLSDVVMPGMSGPELAKRLMARRPALKVLCMSGYTDDAVIRHGAAEAGIAFIQKPFTPVTLARKVREALDWQRPGDCPTHDSIAPSSFGERPQ